MNQKHIDVINICLDAMLAFGNEKSKADIKEAKVAFREMVEKATPKPPEYIDYDTCYFKCGACGGEISWTGILEDHKYCLECGQAIKWEDTP